MAENQNNEKQAMPAIMVNSQYIRDLSLEIPKAPAIFAEAKEAPKINVNVDVMANRADDNNFIVELIIKMDGEVNDSKLFIMEMVYGGVVSLNVPEEHIEPVLLIEVPRLFFPFAREAITSLMVNSGLPPFMLNPIDFVALYQQRQQVSANN